MELKELNDLTLLNEIINDSYIQNLVPEAKVITHPLVKYYGCYKDNELMGCYLAIQYSKNEIELHSYLLKKAIVYSRIFGKLIINECFKNPNVTRLTAWIYEDLVKAQNYVKKIGFKLEGIKENAIYRKNKLTNIHMYGLIKEIKWDS